MSSRLYTMLHGTLHVMLTYIFMKRPVADLGISGEKRQRLRDEPIFYVSIGELRLTHLTLKQKVKYKEGVHSKKDSPTLICIPNIIHLLDTHLNKIMCLRDAIRD